MKTKKTIYLKLVCASAMLMLCYLYSTSSSAQTLTNPRFKAIISVMNEEPSDNRSGFLWYNAHVSVQNISEQTEEFFALSCGCELHWESNNKNVFASGKEGSCMANVAGKISLKPNEYYERDIFIGINKRYLNKGDVTFKFRFRPFTQDSKFTADGYWSNELKIKRPSKIKTFKQSNLAASSRTNDFQ